MDIKESMNALNMAEEQKDLTIFLQLQYCLEKSIKLHEVPAIQEIESNPNAFNIAGIQAVMAPDINPDNNPVWDKCVGKGNEILDNIKQKKVVPSKWKDYSSLEENQWKIEIEQDQPPSMTLNTLSAPFVDHQKGFADRQQHQHATHHPAEASKTRLPTKDWFCWKLIHNQWNEQKHDKDSGMNPARYIIDTNAKEGVICVALAYAPTKPEGSDQLCRLSDVAFLCLIEHAARKKIEPRFKWFVVAGGDNHLTREVYTELWKVCPAKLEEAQNPYPGFIVSPDGDCENPAGEGTMARAILGTPSARGAGYILQDHQDTFPGHTIKSVSIIHSGKPYLNTAAPSAIYVEIDEKKAEASGGQLQQFYLTNPRLL